MLLSNQKSQVGAYLAELSKRHGQSRYFHILLGVVLQAMGSGQDAVKSFETAITKNSPEQLPDLTSPATRVYVESQLGIAPQDRPVSRRARDCFLHNLRALRMVDPDLATELDAVRDDDAIQFVDLWGRTHLFNGKTKQVVVIPQNFIESIKPLLNQYVPLVLTSVMSGQELIYVLENQVKDFLLGRKRIVYLFEPELSSLRLQLHLGDFSRDLENRGVVVFSGQQMDRRIDEFFGTLRYPSPQAIVGNNGRAKQHLDRINAILDPATDKSAAEEYYRSPEFQHRLREIAEGRLLPRVLVSTCRWTTFLQYCAKDFQKAFSQLGCETYYQIEEGDTQVLTNKLTWKTLVEFKPDVLFGVSHARPSFLVPPELPVISFVQDRCGPILTLKDLSVAISRRDLFVCMMEDFRRYLVCKNVPSDQTFVMPIPADEAVFHPLPSDDPDVERFTVDVGFVKHCDGWGDQAFNNFVRKYLTATGHPEAEKVLIAAFTDLYRLTCREDGRRHYEQEMMECVRTRLDGIFSLFGADPEYWIRQLVSAYLIEVFGNTWRYQFLEALDKAGIQIGLYGNGWNNHPRFKHLSRGPVKRQTDLKKVYNFSRINLNIHPTSTMHQRVTECALAGGFMINADHAPDKDWESVRPYFEPGREIIMFESADDLVDKCRYYLVHPEERRQIAENARQRALKEQTTTVGARKILDQWQGILRRAVE